MFVICQENAHPIAGHCAHLQALLVSAVPASPVPASPTARIVPGTPPPTVPVTMPLTPPSDMRLDMLDTSASPDGGADAWPRPEWAPAPGGYTPTITAGVFATAGLRGEDRMEDRHVLAEKLGEWGQNAVASRSLHQAIQAPGNIIQDGIALAENGR
jgi:hypothetical protein